MNKPDVFVPAETLSFSVIEDPKFEVRGMLYFLEADYLFRYKGKSGMQTKFLTSGDLAAAFSQTEQDTGWLPAGVVRCGDSPKGKWFVYSAPAQKVETLLEEDGKPVSFPIPRTILMGIGSTYYFWVSKSRHFSADEQVCRAPFPNVYEDGHICWGSNTPAAAAPGIARKVWELFFATPFNAHLATGKSKTEKNDVRAVLHKLAEDNARVYPLHDLVETGSRIKDLVVSIKGGR
jgi:hypothetical protein